MRKKLELLIALLLAILLFCSIGYAGQKNDGENEKSFSCSSDSDCGADQYCAGDKCLDKPKEEIKQEQLAPKEDTTSQGEDAGKPPAETPPVDDQAVETGEIASTEAQFSTDANNPKKVKENGESGGEISNTVAMAVTVVSGCSPACSGSTPNCCNSACTNLKTDTSNCGSCGKVCAVPPNSQPTCANGICSYVCDPGYLKYKLGCKKIDYCNPNPCQNGGVCTSGATGYTCTCLTGWSGTNCDVQYREPECNEGDAAEKCDDDNPCTDDVCVDGMCENPDNVAPCDDQNPCTVNDECWYGACRGTQKCDDHNECTYDYCEDGICEYSYNTKHCDDGNRCTGNDRCSNGECRGTQINCDDGKFCTGTETCNRYRGCEAVDVPTCNDGIACTADSCDTTTDSCKNIPLDSACDDGKFCTGTETCDPVEGCVSGTAPTCDDGIACTTDSCDTITDSCKNVPMDSVCNGGKFCTGTETCDPVEGCVARTAPPCDDGIACTTDSCDETTGSCKNIPVDSVCSDGKLCTGSCDPVKGCVCLSPANL